MVVERSRTPRGRIFFWGYVHDTLVLPAFLYYHDWVWVQDGPSLEFAIPSLATMFRTWKRTFDALLRAGVVVPWSQRLLKVKSVRAFGSRFDCPGFNGRVLLPSGALTDLCAQFSFSPRLSSLRVPAFINFRIGFARSRNTPRRVHRSHSVDIETNVREYTVYT